MDPLALLQAIAGGALLFFVPGYAVSRAIFPEWRLRGPEGTRRALETVVIAFVLSIVLTVLVGYLLLSAAPGGFSAAWSDPLLEAALAAVAAVAAAVAWLEGAFARTPPAPRRLEERPGEEGAWELTRDLDRLRGEERKLLRRLRAGDDPGAAPALRARLEEIERAREERLRAREAEYDL
jgi:MFS family permease